MSRSEPKISVHSSNQQLPSDKPKDSLFRFAWTPDFDQMLRDLRSRAEVEPYFSTLFNLNSYIKYYFDQLEFEGKVVVSGCESAAAFNTGLTDKCTGDSLYLAFVPNRQQNRQEWYYQGIHSGADAFARQLPHLPLKAVFTSDRADLLFDPNIDVEFNTAHLMERAMSPDGPRFPGPLTMPDLQYTLGRTINMVKEQPWLPRAGYYASFKQISSYFPLWAPNSRVSDQPDAVLVLERLEGFYRATTIFGLRQAREGARLLGPLEHSFLAVTDSQDDVHGRVIRMQ